jgi:hypothetical protein
MTIVIINYGKWIFRKNDITDKKQTDEIQEGLANGISADGNHNEKWPAIF